ncbi:MAG: GNAT family N-acetyltransferase, partial [Anaerolineae bacterium]
VVGSATVRQNLRARTTHAGSVGLLVHADHWGQGIGQRLMTAVLDIADNWLGLMRVELEVFVEERPTNMHRLVAEADGRVAGSISLRQRTNPRTTHVGGIGMMVAPDFWGVGIGSRLMTAVLDIADNWLNLKRVELEVHADNPAAIRLYEKFGFEREGTKLYQNFGDGRWPDTHFMARLRKNESIEESHRGQREHREIQRE